MHSRCKPRTVHSFFPVRGENASTSSDEQTTSSAPSAVSTNCGDAHECQTPGRSTFHRFAPVCRSSAIKYDSP